MDFNEEENFLESFEQEANAGHIITTAEIKAEYEKKVGHQTGGSTIYILLKRHGWRKVMPRSQHPNKANAEVINTSKKLTLGWTK